MARTSLKGRHCVISVLLGCFALSATISYRAQRALVKTDRSLEDLIGRPSEGTRIGAFHDIAPITKLSGQRGKPPDLRNAPTALLVNSHETQTTNKAKPAPTQPVASTTSITDPDVLPPPDTIAENSTEFFALPLSQRGLTPLRSIDREQYTIRILTWKRASFLAASVALHSACKSVKQIQVVWSVHQEGYDTQIPHEVIRNPKVYIERRSSNSLNDRFDILSTTPTPTLGILNIDDDLLYTCEALDMGFFLWVQHTDRMVTYAPRRHRVTDPYRKPPQWKYGFHWNNHYSLGLTSTAFLHRDYLHYYTSFLPRDIYHHVGEHMNCEDIAMGLLVSNLTQGLFPLAVDEWGMQGRVQLALSTGYQGIKGESDHMKHRSRCLNWFATDLNLKDKFQARYARLRRVTTSNLNLTADFSLQALANNPRFQALEAKRKEWVEMKEGEFAQLVIKPMQNSLKDFAGSRNLSFEGFG